MHVFVYINMCDEQREREFITRNIDREPVNAACVYVLYKLSPYPCAIFCFHRTAFVSI